MKKSGKKTGFVRKNWRSAAAWILALCMVATAVTPTAVLASQTVEEDADDDGTTEDADTLVLTSGGGV